VREIAEGFKSESERSERPWFTIPAGALLSVGRRPPLAHSRCSLARVPAGV